MNMHQPVDPNMLMQIVEQMEGAPEEAKMLFMHRQKENEKMQKRQDTEMQEEMSEEMRIRELAKQMLQSSQSFQQPIDPMGQAPQQQMGNPITDLLL